MKPLFKMLSMICVVTSTGLAHSTPILLGSDTLSNANDLTLIRLDDGTIYEWLDIEYTVNMSLSESLATYASSGFQVATLSEFQTLLDAFSLPTLSDPLPLSSSVIYNANLQSILNFQSYLGLSYTSLNNLYSIGWIDDESQNAETALINIRNEFQVLGTTDVFFNQFDPGEGDNGKSDRVGVWLFRVASINVPEPSGIILFTSGLLALGSLRRRQTLLN